MKRGRHGFPQGAPLTWSLARLPSAVSDDKRAHRTPRLTAPQSRPPLLGEALRGKRRAESGPRTVRRPGRAVAGMGLAPVDG
jgi:hypothetical protein